MQNSNLNRESPLLEDPALRIWEGPDFALTYVASKTGTVEEVRMSSRAQDHHRSMRTGRYRYILCSNGEEELYDHQNDPEEWHDLADSADFLSLKGELKTKLKDLVDEDPK